MTTHNLFFGGTETTSNTLRYGLLILLKYPEVAGLRAGGPGMRGLGLGLAGVHGGCSSQPEPAPAKVQAELDAVVGRMRAPSLEDRGRLPYTNAVLHEIQRFISVVPLGLPRALTPDTHLHGHFLPKVPTKPGDSVCWRREGAAYLLADICRLGRAHSAD